MQATVGLLLGREAKVLHVRKKKATGTFLSEKAVELDKKSVENITGQPYQLPLV